MPIVVLGTALPEIITGVIAAMKYETDLLLGNILGSNILNICLLICLGSLINPLFFSFEFNISILILVTLFLQIIAVLNKNSELDHKRGIIFIIVYIYYIFCII